MINIGYDVLIRHKDAVFRFLELYPNSNQDKIRAALTVLSNSVDDINVHLKSFYSGDKGVGIFYQLVIKTDILIGGVNFIFNEFLNSEGIKIDDCIKDNLKKFKLIRNLSIAHPLSTTKFEDFGFGEDGNRWCEDIIPFQSYMSLMNGDVQADYVLKYREKNIDLPQRILLTIEKDVIVPIESILEKLDIISGRLEQKIELKVDELRNEPLLADFASSMLTYLDNLRMDLAVRYPSKFETYQEVNSNDCDLKADTEGEWVDSHSVERSILDNVKGRLELIYSDSERLTLYRSYISALEKAIYSYGDAVQQMSLEENDADSKLLALMYPSDRVFYEGSNDSQRIYKLSKIKHIEESDNYTMPSVLRKLQDFTLNDWNNPTKCSNVEFGLMQLWSIRDEVTEYFPIDFEHPDRVIFIQYITALYYAYES